MTESYRASPEKERVPDTLSHSFSLTLSHSDTLSHYRRRSIPALAALIIFRKRTAAPCASSFYICGETLREAGAEPVTTPALPRVPS